jgi:hypothetical protein
MPNTIQNYENNLQSPYLIQFRIKNKEYKKICDTLDGNNYIFAKQFQESIREFALHMKSNIIWESTLTW